MAPNRGNVVVLQSGGPTPVINRSLFGLVDEASTSGAFGRVLGASHGMEGLLADDLIDLAAQPRGMWRRVPRTPGAALGSPRRKLKPEDVPTVLQTLSDRDVRYCFIIGGNDSAETGLSISLEARRAGYDLTVVCVPKTIDNDLVLTDHTPGYGSAARFVALATSGVGADAESMGKAAPIAIVEVMGRDTGWLAASAALGKREDRDPPHVICVPEVPVDEEDFVDAIETAYAAHGFAVAVVAENTRGTEGVLGGQEEPWYVDDFGHAYFDGPGRYLAGLVSRRLKVRARYEKPGTIQRSLANTVSRTDSDEAEAAGRAAVQSALDGHSDVIVTLARLPGKGYTCTTGLAPLSEVAGQVRPMPNDYLSDGFWVTDAFVEYARPLIGASLPRFGRLR